MKHSFLPLALLCGAAFLSSPGFSAQPLQNPPVAATRSVPDSFFEGISGPQLDAMRFLYSNMPLPDVAGYPRDFFLANVEASLKARREMPWGDSVPLLEFRHFVLPIRVNNEALDMSRPQFYAELAPRVKGLSMKDAILEVNHWCHEKVTYQPSDGRTSSPLSAVSQAIGRCGEESTFAVAALRSVGIPARQVYTPRWAHTDDNHAWVEAWADGQWHFLGACEPEPVLDLAWFNAPASRGMLMTTNVLGAYSGPEEQLRARPSVTTINVTSTYAPVADLRVRVEDADGNPVTGAKVNFCIYNYADFYPVASKTSDAHGLASLQAGLGDMVVWASTGDKFGFLKARPDSNLTYSLKLDRSVGEEGNFSLSITPPAERPTAPYVSAEMREANNRRFAYEDSIRRAYTASFISEDRAREIAKILNLDADSTVRVLTLARGNSQPLADMLAEMQPALREKALRLLSVVTEKDLRDIPLDALRDHLDFTPSDCSDPFEAAYVMNPRIETEQITPWRSFFVKNISASDKKKYRSNPARLANYIVKNFTDDGWNPQALTMSPVAAFTAKHADKRSRGILFVAMARSMGIPARFDPITSKPQYADASRRWIDAPLDPTIKPAKNAARSPLHIDYKQAGRLANPKYYHHFSILSLENGVPSQLDFEDGWGVDEINSMAAELAPGPYMVMSGQRMADGGVLAHGEFFNVKEGMPARVPLEILQDSTKVQVIGNLDAETKWRDLDNNEHSILDHSGRGYYILGILSAGSEPTSHSLRDIALMKTEFDDAGNAMLLLFESPQEAMAFDFSAYPELPARTARGIDIDGKVLSQLRESLALTNDATPIFVVADSFGRVVFLSQGYTVGLGHRIISLLNSL